MTLCAFHSPGSLFSMMASAKHKLKRKRSDDDPLWTNRSDGDYNSASSDSQNKLTAFSNYIPRETNEWTMSELENLQVKWNWIDPSSVTSLDEFFDMFQNIKADLPPLDADLIKIEEYLNLNLTFNTTVHELEQENHVKIREYLIENFLPKNDTDLEELVTNLGNSSRGLIHHIEAGRYDFQSDLKDILYDLLLTSRTIEEIRFTTMLEKFCRMCNLKGSVGLVEEAMIKDVRVVAIPDITFRIPSHEMPEVIQIMTVAENLEPTEDETVQTMDPSKIQGFSQHVGQLIIGLGNSCFKKECIGLLLHETKIMMTCLSASPRFSTHVKGQLNSEDTATLHFIGPYDILRAEDRIQLIRAFLRLGKRQRLGQRL